jgi:hypothetical protein
VKYYLFLSLITALNITYGQVAGEYNGSVNGDPVSLSLQQNGSVLTGKMSDSHQTYTIDGKVTNNNIDAKAVEPTMGLTIFLIGSLIDNNTLQLKGDLLIAGVKTPAFNTTLTKKNSSSPTSSAAVTSTSNSTSRPKELVGKTIDPNLIGRWRQESHYNSGYGSSFSGSTYSYLAFNPDHTMSDNGSSASISGSDYSGQSGGRSTPKIIANVWYYTSGNLIMAVINNNGTILIEKMGTYYIENGKMLFTQANTQKKFLYYKE